MSTQTSEKPNTASPPDSSVGTDGPAPMTHTQKINSLIALLMAMFVGMLSNTVVSTSMPRIVHELGGTQAQYSWVIAAAMLTMTISTPIWGKLSDLLNRKTLMQVAIVAFTIGTATAGVAQSPEMLIGSRAIQGLGIGGTMTLSQIVMADIVSPRERGKYMGIFGAIMAIGVVGGPLLGGWITDALSWRYNFYVALPLAVVAFILLQTTLHMPPQIARKFRLDVLGVILLGGGTALLLIWVTMGGDSATASFPWKSVETLWMTSAAVIMLVAFVFVELRSKEPVLDIRLFKNRTLTMSVLGSIAVGLAMFGSAVYLSQFMIMAREASPTMAGVMTIPIMAGVMVSGNVVGQLITRTGVWKPYMIACAALLVAGIGLMATVDADTNYWLMATFMLMMGFGVGGTMQNFVLLTQNAVEPSQVGVGSSTVSFFRSMGGTVGVAWLGGILANKVPELLAERKQELMAAMSKLPPEQQQALAAAQDSGDLPAPSQMPGSVATIFEHAYGEAIAHLFVFAAPVAIVGLLAVIFTPKLNLSVKTRHEQETEQSHTTVEPEEAVSVLVGSEHASAEPGKHRDATDAGNGRHSAPEDRA